MNKKIGFFGGCFNPPTNIHINIANTILKQTDLDKVIFVPVGNFYKKDNLISAYHRYNMLKLATRDFSNIEVEDIELHINREVFAFDIFGLLSQKYNKDKIYFIMGSDNFNNMYKWRQYDFIKDKYNYIVVHRKNFSLKEKKKNMMYIENNQEMSSTKIRELIKSKKDIKKYINEEVCKYIKENKLYIL